MTNSYYKGYWIVTNRCNLRCSYCVLENTPHQLQAELDLEGKKKLISHLYHKLNFRRLTLSGGEVSIIGKNPPNDFIELMRHIRNFRSIDPQKNLEVEIYTNGGFLNENAINEMRGVVDIVSLTIDSDKNIFLSELGRNQPGFGNYFEHIKQISYLLAQNNIEFKLQSVVFQKNHLSLADEILFILDSITKAGGQVSYWKFYQYMSYDVPSKDNMHAIPIERYNQFKEKVSAILKGKNINLHFKDNQEMKDSIFNILSYGNAQYLREGDTWSTSQRTADLCTYNSMTEFFMKNDINEALFRHFNEIFR